LSGRFGRLFAIKQAIIIMIYSYFFTALQNSGLANFIKEVSYIVNKVHCALYTDVMSNRKAERILKPLKYILTAHLSGSSTFFVEEVSTIEFSLQENVRLYSSKIKTTAHTGEVKSHVCESIEEQLS
jgi:hypothetical protein